MGILKKGYIFIGLLPVLLVTVLFTSMTVYAAGNYADNNYGLSDDTVINIKDEVFRYYIYEALSGIYYEENNLKERKDSYEQLVAYKAELKSKGITLAHMKKIKGLFIGDTQYGDGKGGYLELESLEGLEYAVNLEYFKVDMMPHYSVEFLMPLGKCVNLKQMELLSGNSKVNMSFFSGLKNLKELKLGFLGQGDLAPLSSLSSLEKLEFDEEIVYGDNYHIIDLKPLKPLTNLKELKLNRNPIADLTPLQGLLQLKYLGVHSYELKDISPLKSLKQLEHLEVSGDFVNISGLSELINLKVLSVGAHNLKNISGVGKMSKLTHLSIAGWYVSDIKPLSGLVNLVSLRMPHCNIADISPLSKLKQLKILDLGENQIADISPLSQLVSLEELTLQRNKIKDISALRSLSSLRTLSIYENKIEDASPLKGLNHLTSIALGGNTLSKTSKADLQQLWRNTVKFDIDESIILFGDVISQDKPTASISEAQIARLQSYRYAIKAPEYTFQQMAADKADSAKWIYDNFFDKVIALESNEKFFASERLTYITWKHSYVIRGILQVIQADGTVEEQDMEYEFMYGGWGTPQIYYEGQRILSDNKIMKK